MYRVATRWLLMLMVMTGVLSGGVRSYAQGLAAAPVEIAGLSFKSKLKADWKSQGATLEEMPLEKMVTQLRGDFPASLKSLAEVPVVYVKLPDRKGEALLLHFGSEKQMREARVLFDKEGMYPEKMMGYGPYILMWNGRAPEYFAFAKSFMSGGETELFEAIKKGDLAGVKKMAAIGKDLKKARFTTATMNMELMEEQDDLFLGNEYYTDLNVLHLAAMYGHKGMVEYLLAQGFTLKDACTFVISPDPIYKNDGYFTGCPILFPVMSYEQSKMAGYLIDKGVDLTARDDSGYPVMVDLASWGDLEVLMKAVAKGGDPKTICNMTGGNALHMVFDDPEMVAYLLKMGVDPKRKDKLGTTTLASNTGSVEAMKLLVKAGADPHAVDTQGENIMFMVEDLEGLEYLLSLNVDPTLRNKDGEQALVFMDQQNQALINRMKEAMANFKK